MQRGDGNANTYGHSDSDGNCNCNAHGDSYCDSDSHCNGYANSYADTYAEACSFTKASSYAAASPVEIFAGANISSDR